MKPFKLRAHYTLYTDKKQVAAARPLLRVVLVITVAVGCATGPVSAGSDYGAAVAYYTETQPLKTPRETAWYSTEESYTPTRTRTWVTDTVTDTTKRFTPGIVTEEYTYPYKPGFGGIFGGEWSGDRLPNPHPRFIPDVIVNARLGYDAGWYGGTYYDDITDADQRGEGGGLFAWYHYILLAALLATLFWRQIAMSLQVAFIATRENISHRVVVFHRQRDAGVNPVTCMAYAVAIVLSPPLTFVWVLAGSPSFEIRPR